MANGAPRSKREKLLAAAAALFADRGYGSVTLADIGGAVGISGPAVYRHFKSKEAVLGELLVEVSEHLLAEARKIVLTSRGPDDVLCSLVDFHANFAVQNPSLITVQSRELPSLATEYQHQVRRLQRSYVEIWADVIASARGLSRREEALAAAHAAFGLLNSTPRYSGSSLSGLATGRPEGDEVKALIAAMALAALSWPGPVPSAQDTPAVPEPRAGPQRPPPVAKKGRGATRGALVRLVEHGAIAEIILDRPQALNAISTEMAVQLAHVCQDLAARAATVGVVISSSSERAFCAGADLKERANFNDAQFLAQRPAIVTAFASIRAIEVPVIAAVAGYALGGGYELALSCDLIVADATAQVGLPETRVGLVPGGGGTQLLARRAGPAVASDLIFTGRRVAAAEALRLHLVDRVVPVGELRPAAFGLAQAVGANSPLALRAAKRALQLGWGAPLELGLELEDAAWREAAASADRVEGIAAFVEKRSPIWSSRLQPRDGRLGR